MLGWERERQNHFILEISKSFQFVPSSTYLFRSFYLFILNLKQRKKPHPPHHHHHQTTAWKCPTPAPLPTPWLQASPPLWSSPCRCPAHSEGQTGVHLGRLRAPKRICFKEKNRKFKFQIRFQVLERPFKCGALELKLCWPCSDHPPGQQSVASLCHRNPGWLSGPSPPPSPCPQERAFWVVIPGPRRMGLTTAIQQPCGQQEGQPARVTSHCCGPGASHVGV